MGLTRGNKIVQLSRVGIFSQGPWTEDLEEDDTFFRPSEQWTQKISAQQKGTSCPKVGIVILNWNGWKDTLACLRSLQELNYDNFQITVVDNGSTNDSVVRIRQSFPEIEILQLSTNLGFAAGCNVGICHHMNIGAEYVWLLNNDTKVDAQSLGYMVKVAQEKPILGAVGSVLYDMNDRNRIQAWGGGSVNLWFGRSYHFKEDPRGKELSYLTGASVLLRCTALRMVGLLDEGFFMYWEDADLCFRLKKSGWNLGVASRAKVWHKESASLGKTSFAFDLHLWTSMVRFCNRHSPLAGIAAVAGSTRMIAKRLLNFDFARARELCQAVFDRQLRDSRCHSGSKLPQSTNEES